jgi:phage-related tail protein
LTDEKNEVQEQKEPEELDEQESEAEKAKATEPVEQAAKDLQDRMTGLEDRLARLSQDYEGARAAYAYAVEDYKKLAASSNPLVPVEAISGATIEEVKDSLGRALKLVSTVQESLAKQAQASSVPAGAPARVGLDTSAMSTKEKINYGLEQARRKKGQ